jgi:membrane associated rhomboid family serine protease
MGVYDRDYFRRSSSGWGWDGLTPAVKGILVANIAVFVLQILVVREVPQSPLDVLRRLNPEIGKKIDNLSEQERQDPEVLEKLKKKYPRLFKHLDEADIDPEVIPAQRVSIPQEWLELDTARVVRGGQVWRLLTYAFCHDRYGVWHIFFNMLFLYWFGGTLESMYGAREFVLFYLAAAVASGLTFVGLDLHTGSSVPCVGASGAVIAVMMLYAMHYPRETIHVCWLIPVEMRWVMLFYLIWDLHPVLLAMSGERFYFDGIAHAGHLGGLAFGFLYARYGWRLESLAERIPGLRWQRHPRLRLRTEPAETDPEMGRVDELLQKICESGPGSLTDEERALLRDASERLKKRPGRGG